MNSRLNNRLANREDRQGGIATYFENLKELVQINDGSRSFILKTVDCHDQSARGFSEVSKSSKSIQFLYSLLSKSHSNPR